MWILYLIFIYWISSYTKNSTLWTLYKWQPIQQDEQKQDNFHLFLLFFFTGSMEVAHIISAFIGYNVWWHIIFKEWKLTLEIPSFYRSFFNLDTIHFSWLTFVLSVQTKQNKTASQFVQFFLLYQNILSHNILLTL